MQINRKQAISENLLYFMVWLVIILVPVLNSKMMSELHVSLENILIAWRKIAPYLIIFLVHNSIIAPRFMLTHRYGRYVLLDLLLIIGVFWMVDLYEKHLVGVLVSPSGTDYPAEPHKASFTDLELYWNAILGFFMTGANAGIKLYGGVSGSADAAVQALLSGDLAYDPEVRCDHHDHEHGGHGHARGEHGCGGHCHEH